MDALAYALDFLGAQIYLFRETYDDLESNIIREWQEKIPSELYTYNASKHIATVKGGSTVYFRYIRNLDDAFGYQGRSMDYIGIDELTKHEFKAVQILLSCLRSPKGFKPLFRGTCNPGGIGHLWVKERYIEPTKYGKQLIVDQVTGNRIAFIPAQVYDNSILMKNDPAYVKRLENLPEDEKKAYLYGDWNVFAGQYFKEWRYEKHVIEPIILDPSWKRFCSMDWGYNDPTCVLWHCISPNNRIYTYRELYVRQTNASEVAKIIKSMSINEYIEYTVASPDMWQKRGNDAIHGESIAETFINNGVSLIKADNSRIIGWQRMREYLSDASDEIPYWQIFSNCNNLIRTLPTLVYDKNNTEDVSSKCEDHAPESARYALMSRPRPNIIQNIYQHRKAPNQYTFDDNTNDNEDYGFCGVNIDSSFINYGCS